MADAAGGGNAIGPLRILLAASVVVPVLLFGLASALDYRASFAEAERDLARSSDVAREHAAKVLDSDRLVAERVADLVDVMDLEDAPSKQQALHDRIHRMLAGLPQVRTLLVVNRDGRPLVSGQTYPVPHGLDFSDRDYFAALKARSIPVYVSQVETSRLDHQLFFGLVRRREDATGAFAGVVSVAISPAFFAAFYATLIGPDAGADGRSAALVRDDGHVLARFPVPAGAATSPAAPAAFAAAIAQDPEGGGYLGHSLIDAGAPERLYAYRKVQGYPVYVVVGRTTAAIRAGWRATMAGHLVFGVPATLALFLITLTALRRTRREQAALARAQREMERREVAEQALRQSQKMEAIGQLTGGVAHDFNNLLTVVIGNLEMIGRAPEKAERVARLASAGMMAARRGAELTGKLLAFSRRQMLHPQVIDTNLLLRAFEPVLKGGVTEAVSITCTLDPAPMPVRVDPGEFEAAMLNLVANARDAMPDGGAITIATGGVTLTAAELAFQPGLVAGDYVRLAVTDTGPGMTEAVAARAFEPFFTTKEVGRGTGLGLSQVYGFARQAGGHAAIRSAPGAGTTVELLLPRAAATAVDPSRPPSDVVPLRRAAAGEVVLVVEDDPAVLAIAVECMNELGYATLTATNAAEALAIIGGQARIDAMVSDVIMPGGMNGVQLTVQARRLRPGLRVLLTSGYTAIDPGDMPQDVPLLSKPYQREELASRLRVLVGGGG